MALVDVLKPCGSFAIDMFGEEVDYRVFGSPFPIRIKAKVEEGVDHLGQLAALSIELHVKKTDLAQPSAHQDRVWLLREKKIGEPWLPYLVTEVRQINVNDPIHHLHCVQ